MKTQVKLGLVLGGVGFLMLCGLGMNVMAESAEMQVEVEVPSRISITSSKSEINLNATPTPTGKFVWDYTTLTVGTNNETGYTLTMSDKDGDTNLKHVNPSVTATIPTLSGDKIKADFEMNKWGYTLLRAATEVQDSTNFSPVPVNTAAVTIGQSTGPVEAVATNVGMAAKVDTNLPSGVYKDTVTFSAIANYVPNPTFGGITTMQEMTTQICTDETKPSKEATNTTIEHTTDTNLVPEATLTDTRDGKTYVVRKLADGNCWMSQNLALSPNGSTTYTESDTDLHDGRTFQAPAASSIGTTWNYNGSDGPHYLTPQAGYEYFQNGTTASSTGQPTESTGNYYDWPMATAGARDASDNSLIGQNSGEAVDSICPKGWRLPQKEGDKSYKNLLIDNYSISTSSDAALRASPLSLLRAGYYYPDSGSFSERGIDGALWVSIVYSSNGAWLLYFYDSYVLPQYGNYQGLGNSIRCVAR